jgi:hypothetical protein
MFLSIVVLLPSPVSANLSTASVARRAADACAKENSRPDAAPASIEACPGEMAIGHGFTRIESARCGTASGFARGSRRDGWPRATRLRRFTLRCQPPLRPGNRRDRLPQPGAFRPRFVDHRDRRIGVLPPRRLRGARADIIVIVVARKSTASTRRAGRMAMKTKSSAAKKRTASAAKLIDARIKELGDWRGTMLSRLRTLIKRTDPDVVEEWKWRGVPVWAHDGSICTGESYKNVVKLTFFKGAALADPSGLFNSSLDGNVRRAIDFHEGDEVNEKAFESLFRAAMALNSASDRTPKRTRKAAARRQAGPRPPTARC